MWIEAFTNNLSFLISVYRRFKDIKKKGQLRPLVGTVSRWTQVFKNNELQKATPKQKPTSQPDNNNNNKKNLQSKKHLSFWSNYASFTLAINTPFIYVRACMGAQLRPTLGTPWTIPRPSLLSMGILQGRRIERVAMTFSRDLPKLRIQPTSVMSSELAGRFFTIGTTWEALDIGLFHILAIV